MTILPTYTGTLTLNGTSLEVTHLLTIEGGTIARGQAVGVLEVPATATLFEWKGGTIKTQLDTHVNTLLTEQTTKKLGAGGYWYIHAGTVTWDAGSIELASVSGIRIEKDGIFDIWADDTLVADTQNPATFTNSGKLKKSEGEGTTRIESHFRNRGTFELVTGTVHFVRSAIQDPEPVHQHQEIKTVLKGGQVAVDDTYQVNTGDLTGNGAVTGDVVVSDARVIPELGGLPGTIEIRGNYSQDSDSELIIPLNGAGNIGALNVVAHQGSGGEANLDGKLTVKNDPFSTDEIGAQFIFLTYSSVEGNFDTVEYEKPTWTVGGNDYQFKTDKGTNAYRLEVEAG